MKKKFVFFCFLHKVKGGGTIKADHLISLDDQLWWHIYNILFSPNHYFAFIPRNKKKRKCFYFLKRNAFALTITPSDVINLKGLFWKSLFFSHKNFDLHVLFFFQLRGILEKTMAEFDIDHPEKNTLVSMIKVYPKQLPWRSMISMTIHWCLWKRKHWDHTWNKKSYTY